MSAVVTADRGFTWSDEETSVLLKLWGANDAQSELNGKRNFVVYEKISEKMNSIGFIRTASQCREKIKRMKREYTLTKQYNNKTPEGPRKKMRFYSQFEKILLEKQNKNQKNTLRLNISTDSVRRSKKKNKKSSEKRSKCVVSKLQTEPGWTEPQYQTDSKEKDEIEWSPDTPIENEETSTLENHNTLSPNIMDDSTPRKKKKMSSKISFFQCMMDSLTLKFMKYQNESDARFLDKIEELELERIKMDEKIQKMWLDFEDRRRADERAHELNVMSAFHRILNQVKNNDVAKD